MASNKKRPHSTGRIREDESPPRPLPQLTSSSECNLGTSFRDRVRKALAEFRQTANDILAAMGTSTGNPDKQQGKSAQCKKSTKSKRVSVLKSPPLKLSPRTMRSDAKTKRNHGNGAFECVVCRKFFCQKETLKKHFRIHLGDRSFRCNKCWKSCSWRATIARSPVPPYWRSSSPIGRKSNTKRKVGRSRSMPSVPVVTSTGCWVFGSCSSISAKVVTKQPQKQTGDIGAGPEKNVTTSGLLKASGFRASFRVGDVAEPKAGPYECYICSKKFKQIDEVRKHVQKDHKKTFECMLCGKICDQSNFLSHIHKHPWDRLYRCDVCATSWTLNKRLRPVPASPPGCLSSGLARPKRDASSVKKSPAVSPACSALRPGHPKKDDSNVNKSPVSPYKCPIPQPSQPKRNTSSVKKSPTNTPESGNPQPAQPKMDASTMKNSPVDSPGCPSSGPGLSTRDVFSVEKLPASPECCSPQPAQPKRDASCVKNSAVNSPACPSSQAAGSKTESSAVKKPPINPPERLPINPSECPTSRPASLNTDDTTVKKSSINPSECPPDVLTVKTSISRSVYPTPRSTQSKPHAPAVKKSSSNPECPTDVSNVKKAPICLSAYPFSRSARPKTDTSAVKKSTINLPECPTDASTVKTSPMNPSECHSSRPTGPKTDASSGKKPHISLSDCSIHRSAQPKTDASPVKKSPAQSPENRSPQPNQQEGVKSSVKNPPVSPPECCTDGQANVD